ncbi:metal-dependent hydrolase [Haloprofundus halobius]|uniref:metal-dependent hydrolase n=1 Tax=Haloprofundus halobius TaxID=2876194 RepID=UPI001CCE835D|nr:metal-dependent hydrolase [Haloprofundus halobius]
MWPWGHLAFGYVCYSLWSRLDAGSPPSGVATLALAFGTQFPDLVDKPLAWTLRLLPSGRSLTHSAFTMVFVVAAVYVYARRRGKRELAVAFGVGYASHLLGDSLYSLLSGEYWELAFLLYPLTYTDYGVEYGFLYHLSMLSVSSISSPEVGLVLAVTALWVLDGAPGPLALKSLLERAYGRFLRASESEVGRSG